MCEGCFSSDVFSHKVCFACYCKLVKNELENLCISLCKLERTNPALLNALSNDMEAIDKKRMQVFAGFQHPAYAADLDRMIKSVLSTIAQHGVHVLDEKDEDEVFSYSYSDDDEYEVDDQDEAAIQNDRLRRMQENLHLKYRR